MKPDLHKSGLLARRPASEDKISASRIIAARALGLDTGPMSSFDNEAVDREFFPSGRIKSNFLCAPGHGDPMGQCERLPCPAFSEVCSIV